MPWTNTELTAEPGIILITSHTGSRLDASRPNRSLPPAIPVQFPGMKRLAIGLLALTLELATGAGVPRAGSLDLGTHNTGLSIGNSKNWTGLRINVRDMGVEQVTGVNLTLWKPGNNGDAAVTGLSLGLVAPDAGTLRGVQLGLAGVGAHQKISGISAGLLGVGSEGSLSGISIGGIGVGAGSDMTGISIGGLAAGAGDNVRGITFALLAAGAGDNLTGITFGGLAAGAGNSMRGISLGGLTAGAGDNATGITIAGLAAGAGDDVRGITFALLAAGAGDNLTGITFGGLAAGAGNSASGLTIGGFAAGAGDNLRGITIALIAAGAGDTVKGFTVGGLAAGAGDKVTGITFGGLAAGGKDVHGMLLTAGLNRISNDGKLCGLAIGSFNQVRGSQTGLSLGIINYTRQLRGIQIGLLNHVAENPVFFRTLPIVNAHF